MNTLKLSVLALLLFSGIGCQENISEANAERKRLLTEGIWEISNDTEVGQVGAQIKYYIDGRAQVRENSTSNWYPDYLEWTMSDDGEEFTMNGTNGPGTFDQFKILELTVSICRGRIINSSSSNAVGKISKMFKAQE